MEALIVKILEGHLPPAKENTQKLKKEQVI